MFPATASTTASTSARPAASNRCCGDTVEGSFHSSVERIRRYAGVSTPLMWGDESCDGLSLVLLVTVPVRLTRAEER